jgi:hypothetical protein
MGGGNVACRGWYDAARVKDPLLEEMVDMGLVTFVDVPKPKRR